MKIKTKKTFSILTLLLVFFFSSCQSTRYITEKFIKTEIEKHHSGDFSSISTYSIMKGYNSANTAYLELTGYKLGNEKGLVIGADRYYTLRYKPGYDVTKLADINYITLTVAQCQAILDNYTQLQDKIKSSHPKLNEEIYQDFTVSDDLFISFRKSSGSAGISTMNLWIKGDKYILTVSTVISNLKKFMAY